MPNLNKKYSSEVNVRVQWWHFLLFQLLLISALSETNFSLKAEFLIMGLDFTHL